jgi:hypothetical protein
MGSHRPEKEANPTDFPKLSFVCGELPPLPELAEVACHAFSFIYHYFTIALP